MTHCEISIFEKDSLSVGLIALLNMPVHCQISVEHCLLYIILCFVQHYIKFDGD